MRKIYRGSKKLSDKRALQIIKGKPSETITLRVLGMKGVKLYQSGKYEFTLEAPPLSRGRKRVIGRVYEGKITTLTDTPEYVHFDLTRRVTFT